MILAAALAFSQPALADWQVSQGTDPATGRVTAVATLPALEAPAMLRVSCRSGRIVPVLVFETSIVPAIGLGDVRTVLRYDDEAPRARLAPLSESGRELGAWQDNPTAGVRRLAKARRLRVEVSPQGEDPFIVAFDLRGAEQALRQVTCEPVYNKAPPMSDRR
jgi:hypothetical protein